jgi:chromosome segregation ATPase
MFEERREYKATIDTLANKLEQVKLAMKKKADELEDFSNEHKHTVGKLTTDKDNLTARVEELSETLIRTKNLMQQREHSITQMQQKFTIDLENANAVIQEKIIFNDTSNAKFNQLNLPSFDRPLKIKRDEIMASGIVMFKKLADIMKETSDAEHEKLLLANRNPDIIDEMRHLNRKTGQLTQETYAQLTSVLDAFKACATPTGSQEELFLRSSVRSRAIIKNVLLASNTWLYIAASPCGASA